MDWIWRSLLAKAKPTPNSHHGRPVSQQLSSRSKTTLRYLIMNGLSIGLLVHHVQNVALICNMWGIALHSGGGWIIVDGGLVSDFCMLLLNPNYVIVLLLCKMLLIQRVHGYETKGNSRRALSIPWNCFNWDSRRRRTNSNRVAALQRKKRKESVAVRGHYGNGINVI